jgi:hypothetical protein
MPFPLDGKDVAVVVDEQPGRPRAGQVPAFMWMFDVTDETDPKPLSSYTVLEESTPYRQGELSARVARFGAHQCHERMRDSLVYVAWFRGGLRVVDIANPSVPEEVGSSCSTASRGWISWNTPAPRGSRGKAILGVGGGPIYGVSELRVSRENPAMSL